MTQSLPGARDLGFEGKHAPMGWASRMQGVVTIAGAKVIPWIPTAAQRMLVRGHAIMIDGNTLDPALQLMLTGQHVVGIDGLVVATGHHRNGILLAPGTAHVIADLVSGRIPALDLAPFSPHRASPSTACDKHFAAAL